MAVKLYCGEKRALVSMTRNEWEALWTILYNLHSAMVETSGGPQLTSHGGHLYMPFCMDNPGSRIDDITRDVIETLVHNTSI